ncbi:hypothetical protein [Psychroserpens sp. SPM9]|uniref:hypothetical protein n=1 Tax=Psychroserpens sp. SPM9 TaxID=2975598 RepID=UPI0021A5DFB3|nr:hypothetical protein [Psychroserpens sp. SPM9]MDG5491578.1 hypothetical protein [Psychroserpens sp. SPM9]
MKSLTAFICIACFIGTHFQISAQESTTDASERHPIYEYSETHLNNTDTIPGFDSKPNKLKVSGTIYESDGVTPAKDVILFIEQADEFGDFDLREVNDQRYVENRGWIKTDADGQYTFYTYVPGNDRRYRQLQQLFPVIKEASKPEYEIASFLFEDDPLLTKRCRRQIAKANQLDRILKPKTVDGVLVVQKDIVLSSGAEASK